MELSFKAKSYIGLVITLGALVLCFGFYHWQVTNLSRLLWYLTLSIPGSCLKVRLPGIKVGTMSVLFMFVIAAMVELTFPETLVIGSVCVVAQSLWHSKFGARPIQIAFSVAAMAIAIAATDLAYQTMPSLQSGLRLGVAVSIFFLANTAPIAVVIGLTEEKPIFTVWKESYLWCLPYYLIGAGVLAVAQSSYRLLNWQVALLVLPIAYVIYRSYNLHLNQLQFERNRAEEEHLHATKMEALHTQTVSALAAATSANARLDAVVRASPLALITLDRDGKVTAWNSSAEHIFGWTAEEMRGKPLSLASDQTDALHDYVERTLRGESIRGVEEKQRRKDNTRFEAAIWTSGLRDAEGSSGVLVTIDDISVRKRLLEELRVAQKMEAIGRLAGGVAHDFNNLLTAIIGYNGVLMEMLAGEPEMLHCSRQVEAAANRAAALTRRLLTFSRRQVSTPKLMNANTCVTNTQNLLSRLIGEDIEIVTKLEPNLGNIRLDPVELDQIIMNLAVNSRDAMPNGGRLTIETSNVTISSTQALESGMNPGDYVRLRVQDTGVGMDAETKSRLFEPFFTTKEQGKGTGLGLSIVYGIVQQNGGFIRVESELGAGVTFSLYFLRVAESSEAETSSSKTAAAPTAIAGATVLLVEDDPVVRQLAAALLTAQGYRVLEAASPLDAIVLAEKHGNSIRLLLTDVLMPGMRGNELAERLRASLTTLPVLYMSGYSDSTFLRPGALEGSRFLQKPFQPAELLRAVSEAIQGTPTVQAG